MSVVLSVKGIQRHFFGVRVVIKKAIKLKMTRLSVVCPLGNENEVATCSNPWGLGACDNVLKTKTAPALNKKPAKKWAADRHCFAKRSPAVMTMLMNASVVGIPMIVITTNILLHMSVRMLCNT